MGKVPWLSPTPPGRIGEKGESTGAGDPPRLDSKGKHWSGPAASASGSGRCRMLPLQGSRAILRTVQ
jgi:hypothetical protein